ncbi:GL23775 [Drosophila persimilis]|uniref:GL23775 n=1 Tax=Drosophila persimilis TaxID=7234 RepID=B4G5X7_DROPE|nr:O-glucosyltransferase rumi [Drosophila persimilis]EDW23732.1 GL23775 [Drosophila persimilis]
MGALALPLALLLLCAFQVCSASEGKCCANRVAPWNFSLDFVPHILHALDQYRPCSSQPSDPDCECHALTIRRDLGPYAEAGITRSMMAQSRRLGVVYQVIDGRIYRQPEVPHPKRCADVEDMLLGIAGELPNVEFILNVRDWPQVPFLSGFTGPVFSHSVSHQHLDIMCPAWSFSSVSGPPLQRFPHGIGQWGHMRRHMAAAAAQVSWEHKQPIGFFRGTRSSTERDTLVRLSRRSPDLVDAQYTSNVGAETVDEVPFSGHCQYKYLFNFGGITASFRLRHILLCKSLVLHVGDQWQEFFYSSLKPWVHYVPAPSNATVESLEQLLVYLRLHDDLAEEIAERGFQFVWQHLRLQDVQCYWRNLLQEYAKLLKCRVEQEPEFIEVRKQTKALQKFEFPGLCQCDPLLSGQLLRHEQTAVP